MPEGMDRLPYVVFPLGARAAGVGIADQALQSVGIAVAVVYGRFISWAVWEPVLVVV